MRAAFLRETRGFHKHILTVIFATLTDKISLMKQKREFNGKTDIYCNHSMPPATREIFAVAKKNANKNGSSVFLRSGEVIVQDNGNKRIKIASFTDLGKLIQPVAASTRAE